MAHLALPGSELLVGVEFEHDPRVQRLLAANPTQSVVVYPSANARPLAELADLPDPLTIWLIDGTWWQAHKIWQRNPWLHALPAYRIEPAAPSRYLIRAEPAAHCVSSVEAVVAALDASEGAPGRHAALLEPLTALVERQLGHASSGGREHRRRARPMRARYLPELLRGRLDDALLIHGEGNAWPASMDPRPPTELAHWLAIRPASGERFSALVRPRAGLSVSVEYHIGLGAAAFEHAISPETFASRWAEFVRPSDVWCAWGHVPAALVATAGVAPPTTVDLRAWTHRALRARPGRIEAAHTQIAADPRPTVDPGRGGLRMAQIEAIFTRLTTQP